MNKIVVLIQGPIYTNLNGWATSDILKSLCSSKLRCRFFILCSVWEDEPTELVRELSTYADKVVRCPKPSRPGSCNRNYQRQSVICGLQSIEQLGYKYVLKTRSDILLSEKFLQGIVELADKGSEKVLVTNMVTRYESFHISDLVVFSTFNNIKDWFDLREVYYEDVYSPEVQFSRVFIRNKKLNYTMRTEDYLAFLRDWIELKDWQEQEFVWFKRVVPGRAELRLLSDTITTHKVYVFFRRAYNFLFRATFAMVYERDSGPVVALPMSTTFHRFISTTKIPLPLIAASLAISDVVFSFILRYFPPLKSRWNYYTVDSKGKEQEKPIA